MWDDRQGKVKSTDAVLPWPYDTYRQLDEDWQAIQEAAGIPEGEHAEMAGVR